LRLPGKTELRLAFAILVTAVVPLALGLGLASSLFSHAAAIGFQPEIGQQLDRGILLYKDYVKTIKDDMRHQTDAIVADEKLRDAAKRRSTEQVEARLDALFPRFPELVSIVVKDEGGNVLARRDRGRPVDKTTERDLVVPRALGDAPGDGKEGPLLEATFAIDRRRLDELASGSDVVAEYHKLEQSQSQHQLYAPFMKSFGLLVFITMLVAGLLGYLLARGVTRRINRLAAALDLVAEGDLSVRVPVTGSDELTDLARTFNRMLGEMAQSRARIEFLQRMGAWQEMAQRLAHEIKNPLTPIQLAVQECHRKYAGDDPRFRALLDTTLEIVEEEVGTLRRLVGNFSNFARLPHAELREESLRDFLRECSEQLGHLEDAAQGEADGDGSPPDGVQDIEIAWKLPETPLPVAIDRQMLRRVLINLVRNAVQAIRDTSPARSAGASAGRRDKGRVVVTARPEGDGAAIEIEDDGPGIPDDARARVFDPYFTTKVDGTGLGLAIVKKIVVEHGGSIDVGKSARLGGARFVVHLPNQRTLATAAARERASRAELEIPPSSGK
jgi:nitrogen fixation/metabolism regulation signal transduction histidine kinase